MCLSKVDEPMKIPRNKIGYKYVLKRNGEYYPPSTYPESEPYLLNKVNIAKDESSRFAFRTEPGFHIFRKKSEALQSRWGKPKYYEDSCMIPVLIKVRFGKVTKTGYGDGFGGEFAIIIADEMTIIGEV